MDDPSLPPADLQQAVDDINKINRLLGGFAFTKDAVVDQIACIDQTEITIVDAGCGDGEMLRYLRENFKDKRVNYLGLDFSRNSIESAREKSKGLSGLRFRESDILKLTPQDINCDILISSLTMHHFTDADIVDWLSKFKELTRHAIIINDLHRHRVAYGFFRLFAPFITKHTVSLNDGLISIASGFKKADFEMYARSIGCDNYKLDWKWSFRYVWTILIDECKN